MRAVALAKARDWLNGLTSPFQGEETGSTPVSRSRFWTTLLFLLQFSGMETQIKKLPPAPLSVWKLLGPSFILLGLGLGTGELILWPYLSAHWGLGIMWAALLGITIQYFLNMEIARYSLARGESIFVGFSRLKWWLPLWFVASTILAWSWPAFSTASATVLASFIPLSPSFLAVTMLLLVGLILTLGPSLYKTVESVEKLLIAISIPTIIVIALLLVRPVHLGTLLQGLVGIGEGYAFIPSGDFPFMLFLGAFAYAGAGGNLLLAQSFYVKEKGYAMGAYASKISSVISKKKGGYSLEGATFEPNPQEVSVFRQWWSVASREHAIVFWGLGLLTMLMLSTIAYVTVYPSTDSAQGIAFLFTQASAINAQTGGILGSVLLVITSIMLFSTQLSVIDGASRIIAENVTIALRGKMPSDRLPYVYYFSVWILILFGILVLSVGIKEPQVLIVIGAVINALCMTVFAGMLNKVNSHIHPQVQAPVWRKRLITVIFIILVLFSMAVFYDRLI